tara:strand:+ start:50 stop:229 length:180 start_codon:yes stop_codon:yes gene_type:complete
MTTAIAYAIIFFLILIFINVLGTNLKLGYANKLRKKQIEIAEEQQRLLKEIYLGQSSIY